MDSEMIYIIFGSIATILLIFLYRKWLNKKHPSYHKIDDGIVTVSIHRSRRHEIYYVHYQFKKDNFGNYVKYKDENKIDYFITILKACLLISVILIIYFAMKINDNPDLLEALATAVFVALLSLIILVLNYIDYLEARHYLKKHMDEIENNIDSANIPESKKSSTQIKPDNGSTEYNFCRWRKSGDDWLSEEFPTCPMEFPKNGVCPYCKKKIERME